MNTMRLAIAAGLLAVTVGNDRQAGLGMAVGAWRRRRLLKSQAA